MLLFDDVTGPALKNGLASPTFLLSVRYHLNLLLRWIWAIRQL